MLEKEGLDRLTQRIKSFTPAIIATVLSWTPSSDSASSARESKPHKEIKVNRETPPYLNAPAESSLLLPEIEILAQKIKDNNYNYSIGFVSATTESPEKNSASAVNPSQIYFGQHQMGNTESSGYMIRKYLAYALYAGSDYYVEDIKKYLMIGTIAQRDKVIARCRQIIKSYDDENKIEDAFDSPQYLKLVHPYIRVNKNNFILANEQHQQESSKLQKDFIIKSYMNMMPTSMKSIVKRHQDIDFTRISPETYSVFIAVSVKIGNGKAINKLINFVKNKYAELPKEQKYENIYNYLNSPYAVNLYCKASFNGRKNFHKVVKAYREFKEDINKLNSIEKKFLNAKFTDEIIGGLLKGKSTNLLEQELNKFRMIARIKIEPHSIIEDLTKTHQNYKAKDIDFNIALQQFKNSQTNDKKLNTSVQVRQNTKGSSR